MKTDKFEILCLYVNYLSSLFSYIRATYYTTQIFLKYKILKINNIKHFDDINNFAGWKTRLATGFIRL